MVYGTGQDKLEGESGKLNLKWFATISLQAYRGEY